MTNPTDRKSAEQEFERLCSEAETTSDPATRTRLELQAESLLDIIDPGPFTVRPMMCPACASVELDKDGKCLDRKCVAGQ